MIRIINPESFYLEGEDFEALRDICDLALHFSKGQRLSHIQNGRHEKALELANKVMGLPISFVRHEE